MLLNRFNECYRVETGRLLPYTILAFLSIFLLHLVPNFGGYTLTIGTHSSIV